MTETTTDVRELERRYRRWLVCYPRSFRRAHETELLAVLVALSVAGQRHPAISEVVALVRSGLLMRLSPDLPRSAGALRTAVSLLCACAALEIATGCVMLATIGGAATRLAAEQPGLGERAARASVVGNLLPALIAVPIVTVLWLFLAWANGRRRRWAPGALLALFLLISVTELEGVTGGAAHYALADLVTGSALWLTALVAVVLTLHSASTAASRSAA